MLILLAFLKTLKDTKTLTHSLIFENKACVRIKRDCVRFFFLFFLQFLGEMITFFIL